MLKDFEFYWPDSQVVELTGRVKADPRNFCSRFWSWFSIKPWAKPLASSWSFFFCAAGMGGILHGIILCISFPDLCENWLKRLSSGDESGWVNTIIAVQKPWKCPNFLFWVWICFCLTFAWTLEQWNNSQGWKLSALLFTGSATEGHWIPSISVLTSCSGALGRYNRSHYYKSTFWIKITV